MVKPSLRAEGCGKGERRGWGGVGSLGPVFTLISRDQHLVGHNIFQHLIHISMAPLGAPQTLYLKKGEFWIALKPLEHYVPHSAGFWCSTGFSASAKVGRETLPLFPLL